MIRHFQPYSPSEEVHFCCLYYTDLFSLLTLQHQGAHKAEFAVLQCR
jgi:hypothetical protein